MKPPIQEVATSLGKENLYRRLRYPQIIFAILLVAIGAVAIRNEFVLTGREQARIIEEVRRSIRASYVDAGRAQEIDRALADRTQRIRHFSFSLGPVLAFSLTENLRGTAHDRHLGVMYSPFAIPEDNGGHSNPAEIQREHSREVSENFGFEHVEVINGNIGYMELRHFADPELAAETLASIMDRMESTRALIIDLRRNHGGSPYMGLLVASYFFEEPVHWVDLKSRNRVEELWTLPWVKGKRYLNKPVYVLTSSRTFSAGEGFSYHMRNLKRATVVGEQTLGGANPGMRKRLSRHFWMFLPTMRAVSPITGTNWDGVGVQPDVSISADQALSIAVKLAAGGA